MSYQIYPEVLGGKLNFLSEASLVFLLVLIWKCQQFPEQILQWTWEIFQNKNIKSKFTFLNIFSNCFSLFTCLYSGDCSEVLNSRDKISWFPLLWQFVLHRRFSQTAVIHWTPNVRPETNSDTLSSLAWKCKSVKCLYFSMK